MWNIYTPIRTDFLSNFIFHRVRLLQYRVFTMWILPCWPLESQEWDDNTLKLLLLERAPDIGEVSVEEIIDKSEKCPVKLPIETVRCKYLKEKSIDCDILNKNINSVYPILHEKALYLSASVLLHKKLKGTPKEKLFYANLSLVNFIERLLTKKAVVFVGPFDSHTLVDGSQGVGDWEIIGTPKETERLNSSKYLSYDELKLSALLSISSYTYFINDGNRRNCGKWAKTREHLEDEGIIISLIGTRFHKPNAMESQEILVIKDRNTKGNGYGQKGTFNNLIAKFYDEKALTYDQVVKNHKKNDSRYLLRYDLYFDNVMYAKRLSLSFDTLLLEANERAKSVNKTAFIHVVGIGLGTWSITNHQNGIFIEIFLKRVQFLEKVLTNVTDIFFDYMDKNNAPSGYDNIGNGIRVYFGKRNPHEKLTGDNQGKLLVVSYAADSNSFPGNEFWDGSLDTSSDPAAASSTQIAELHTPLINRHVSAANLRIATLSGILTLREYIQKIVVDKKIK